MITNLTKGFKATTMVEALPAEIQGGNNTSNLY